MLSETIAPRSYLAQGAVIGCSNFRNPRPQSGFNETRISFYGFDTCHTFVRTWFRSGSGPVCHPMTYNTLHCEEFLAKCARLQTKRSCRRLGPSHGYGCIPCTATPLH